jgi:hypothetical protein
MTGPGEGKYVLKGAKVYIHEKGKSRARITHIDIEHPLLNAIIKPGEASYVQGKEGGCFIGLKKEMLARVEALLKKLKAKTENSDEKREE